MQHQAINLDWILNRCRPGQRTPQMAITLTEVFDTCKDYKCEIVSGSREIQANTVSVR